MGVLGGVGLLLWLRGTPQVRWAGSGPVQATDVAFEDERGWRAAAARFQKARSYACCSFLGLFWMLHRRSTDVTEDGGKTAAAAGAEGSLSAPREAYFAAAHQRIMNPKLAQVFLAMTSSPLNTSAIHHASIRKLTFS